MCGKTGISLLLAKGKHGSIPGMRFLYLDGNGKEENRIMVSVPKKMFKRAVKRNLLKRRIRESYRKQKHLLACSGVDILFMYSTKEVLEYGTVHEMVGEVLSKVSDSINKKK